jgi:hypothetical protein
LAFDQDQIPREARTSIDDAHRMRAAWQSSISLSMELVC